MRRFSLLSSILLLAISFKAQAQSREFKFPEIGWTINVPSDITVLDSAKEEALSERGKEAIEKTFDTTVDISDTKILISLTKGLYNYFSTTITPLDTVKDGPWIESIPILKHGILETFMSQMPDMKIDTSSSVEKIKGLDFQVFHLILTYPNGMVMHCFIYDAMLKGYDFGVSISYTDEKIGGQLKEILTSSKFEN